jgi:hypothetical protein
MVTNNHDDLRRLPTNILKSYLHNLEYSEVARLLNETTVLRVKHYDGNPHYRISKANAIEILVDELAAEEDQ